MKNRKLKKKTQKIMMVQKITKLFNNNKTFMFFVA